jgi:hypothetical protein
MYSSKTVGTYSVRRTKDCQVVRVGPINELSYFCFGHLSFGWFLHSCASVIKNVDQALSRQISLNYFEGDGEKGASVHTVLPSRVTTKGHVQMKVLPT